MCCRWQAGTKHQKEAVSIAGGYCAHHGAGCWSVSRSIPCVVYPAIVAAWSCKWWCLFMPGFSVPAPPTHPRVAQYTLKQATEKGSCILRLEQHFSTFCLYFLLFCFLLPWWRWQVRLHQDHFPHHSSCGLLSQVHRDSWPQRAH